MCPDNGNSDESILYFCALNEQPRHRFTTGRLFGDRIHSLTSFPFLNVITELEDGRIG